MSRVVGGEWGWGLGGGGWEYEPGWGLGYEEASGAPKEGFRSPWDLRMVRGSEVSLGPLLLGSGRPDPLKRG